MNKKHRRKLCKSVISVFTTLALFMNLLPTFLPARAASPNVYYLATDGNDGNPGTETAPFGTVSGASSKLQPGDTLIIKAGTYTGYLLINTKGSEGSAEITVKNYNSDHVVIQGDASRGYAGYVLSSYNVSVSGLEFTFSNNNNSGTDFYIHNSHNVTVRNCVMRDATVGVYAREGSKDYEVSGCRIENCRSDNGGITVYNASGGKWFNNLITGCYYGVQLISSATHDNAFYNNTLYGNDYDLYTRTDLNGTPANNHFENNIFGGKFKNSETMIPVNDFDYNCYNTASPNLSEIVEGMGQSLTPFTGSGKETHGFMADAGLVSPASGNFNLKDGSACIKKGSDSYTPDSDIAGTARSIPVDIGAYAYGVSSGHVYYLAETGSDSNPGSYDEPFGSVSYASSRLQPGDTLMIRSGTYSGRLLIQNQGAGDPDSADIYVRSYQNEPVTVDGSSTGNGYAGYVLSSNNVHIKGVRFECSGGVALYIHDAHGTIVQNCTMADSNVGVYVREKSDAYEISGCTISNCRSDNGGITLYQATNGLICNNIIDGSYYGIQMISSDTNSNKISSNTCYGNDYDLYVRTDLGGTPKGNSFYNNIFGGKFKNVDDFLTQNRLDYDCYNTQSPTLTEIVEGGGLNLDALRAAGQERHGLIGNARLVNPAAQDDHLGSRSSCIAAGTAEGIVATDRDGVQRTSPVDIGAYVYIASKTAGHIYYLSTTGSDGNSGSIDHPFGTLAYVSGKLQPGDTLLIRGGDYNGYLVINTQGYGNADSAAITVRNYGNEKVRIKNDVKQTSYVAYVLFSSNVTLQGLELTFKDTTKSGTGLIIHDCINVTVRNCVMHDVDCGVMVREGTAGYEVSGCRIYNCTGDYGGIFLYNCTGGKVFNNVVTGCNYGFETADSHTTSNAVYNNTFYGNPQEFWIRDLGGIPVGNVYSNNIFSGVMQDTKEFYANNTFDYNFYDTASPGMKTEILSGSGQVSLEPIRRYNSSFETHGQTGDPRFKDAANGDFSILSNSPCISSGNTGYIPSVDFSGLSRKGIAGVGAYAYDSQTKFYVSAQGSDSNPGTEASPLKTIAAAVAKAADGSAIFLEAGSYDEDIAVSGKNGISLKPYNSQDVTLNGNLSFENCSDCSVSNVTVNGSIRASSAGGTTVSGAVIHGSVEFDSSDGFSLLSNKFMSGKADCAVTVKDSESGSVFNNLFVGNDKNAVSLSGTSTQNAIFNNVFYQNGGKDLAMNSTAQNTVKNNIFASGLSFDSDAAAKANTFDYNCYDSASLRSSIGTAGEAALSFADFSSGDSQETNGFVGDPGFMNTVSQDFRLYALSSCKGAGTSEGAPACDILGISRSNPYDIGAYQYSGEANVFYVSKSGSDSGPGTQEAPFATIQHAVDILRPGETIIVREGTYSENVVIDDKDGTSGLHYTLKAYPGETVKLSASSSGTDTGISVTGYSSYWEVEGFHLDGFAKSAVEISKSAEHIAVADITADNISGTGISVDGAPGCTVRNCTVNGNSATTGGIVANDAPSVTIAQNRIYHVGGIGIRVTGSQNAAVNANILYKTAIGADFSSSDLSLVYNNTFYDNSQCDLKLEAGCSGGKIRNNIFGSSAVVPVLLTDADAINADFNYNDYNRDGGQALVSIPSENSQLSLADLQQRGKETNGLTGNPKFRDVSSLDFVPAKGSPCIRGGVSDGNNPKYDNDGNAFVAPVEMGALYSPYSFNTYYVATTGSNSADGSAEHPWKTILYGATRLRTGDTLYIRGGNYNERIDINDMKAGADYPYTISNYPGETVVLNTNNSQDVGIKFVDSSYWNLRGLQMTGYTGAAVWITSNSTHISVSDMEIWNISNPDFVLYGTEGILGDGYDCSVTHCYIHDIGLQRRSNADHGIYLGYGAYNWTIDSNTIVNAPGGGLQLYGRPVGGNNCTITNNVFQDNKYGIIATMGDGNLISNNTFVNNWFNDIYFDYNFNDSLIQNNIFYNNIPVGTTTKIEDVANQTTKDYTVSPTVFGFYHSEDGCEVSGNTFRNNMVVYKTFAPCVLDGEYVSHPLADYVKSQTANTYKDLWTGSDPGFKDVANSDYSLADGSVCIDRGIADRAPAVDIDGKARVNGPDLGAYEGNSPKKPSLPGSVTEPKSGVTVDLGGAVFPDTVTSVTLSATVMPDSGSNNAVYQKVSSLIGKLYPGAALKNLVVYDLALLDQDGNPVSGFTGKIKAKIPIPAGMSGDLHVFWYNLKDGTVKDMNAAVEDGYLVFETDHLSYYAVAQFASSDSSGNNDNNGNSNNSGNSGNSGKPGKPGKPGASGTVSNPATRSSGNPAVPAAAALFALSAALICLKARKRKKA